MEYCPESNSYYETAADSRRNKWIYGKFGNLDDSTAVFFFLFKQHRHDRQDKVVWNANLINITRYTDTRGSTLKATTSSNFYKITFVRKMTVPHGCGRSRINGTKRTPYYVVLLPNGFRRTNTNGWIYFIFFFFFHDIFTDVFQSIGYSAYIDRVR